MPGRTDFGQVDRRAAAQVCTMGHPPPETFSRYDDGEPKKLPKKNRPHPDRRHAPPVAPHPHHQESIMT